MKAGVGDRLVVRSAHLDGPVRTGEVVGVPHADGSPPYTVRWDSDGKESIIYPGPDAHVDNLAGSG